MKTKIIKTPMLGVEVELKAWISGAEAEQINTPITGVKLKVNALGQAETTELEAGQLINECVKIAVGIVIIRLDKETEDVFNKIQEMPNVDYKFILKEVDNIVQGKDFTQPDSKKKDGTD